MLKLMWDYGKFSIIFETTMDTHIMLGLRPIDTHVGGKYYSHELIHGQPPIVVIWLSGACVIRERQGDQIA